MMHVKETHQSEMITYILVTLLDIRMCDSKNIHTSPTPHGWSMEIPRGWGTKG